MDVYIPGQLAFSTGPNKLRGLDIKFGKVSDILGRARSRWEATDAKAVLAARITQKRIAAARDPEDCSDIAREKGFKFAADLSFLLVKAFD
ncbi:MAG TPA: hypothetical protein VM077_06095 [Candidatus Limnocylindrales bacterium]|nr:hypothetical protein [Candidatus Limnocylindrales bacterium]